MYQYDPKRYKTAPWKPRFGTQEHALKVHPHQDKIEATIAAKKKEMVRLEEQIHQLEELKRISRGDIVEGVLVRQSDEHDHYGISLVDQLEYRAAQIYPNAHNKGETFGVHIYMDGHPYRREEWMGAGHTLEQAIETAKTWVIHKKKLTKRYDTIHGTIREEEP